MKLAAIFATLTFSTASLSAEQKNILIITVDDLKPNLGCYGDKFAKTPNIDALASRGTVMLSNYCQQAVCSASRVSTFTGMRPDSTGVLDLHCLLYTSDAADD